MGIRCATVILGAVILAGIAVCLTLAVDPERARAATIAVRTCGGGTIKLNAKEERTLHLHNHKRTSRDLRPLCVHPKLTQAARAHSASMIKKDYFRHGSVGTRLKHNANNCKIWAKNIPEEPVSYGSP